MNNLFRNACSGALPSINKYLFIFVLKISNCFIKFFICLDSKGILYSAPIAKIVTVLSSFATLAILGRINNQFLVNSLALSAALSILIAVNDKGSTIANSNPSLKQNLFFGVKLNQFSTVLINASWIIAAFTVSFFIFYSKDGFISGGVVWIALISQVFVGTILTRWMHVKKRSDQTLLGLVIAELIPSLIRLGTTISFLYMQSFVFYFSLLSIFLLGFTYFVVKKFRVQGLICTQIGRYHRHAESNIDFGLSGFYYSIFSSSRDQILFLMLPVLGLATGAMLSVQAKMVQSANLILAGIYPLFVRYEKSKSVEKIKKILIVMTCGVIFLSLINNFIYEIFEFIILGKTSNNHPPYIFSLLSWIQPLISSFTYVFLISSRAGYAILLEKIQLILAFSLIYISFKIAL